MSDNTKAKTHLKTAETKLNDLSNVSEINKITAARSLDLFNNLHTGNNLFVDDEVKIDIENVRNRLQTWALVADAANEITQLNTDEAALPTGASSSTRRAEIGRDRTNLLRITGGTALFPWAWSTNVINRQTEYNNLTTYANYFNTWSRMGNVDLDITTPVWTARAWIANINQNLDWLFKTAPWNPNANYTLCDDQWQPLAVTGGNYTIQIWWQTATLSWINLGTRTLDLTNLIITPPTVDLSQPLKLSINGTYPAAAVWVNNVNLVCNKKFQLQLRNGPAPIPMDTLALRQIQIDTYNTTAPGNIVENELVTQYNNRLPSLQRETVFEALKHLDGIRFSQLEEYGKKNGKENEIKEELYQQIYRNFLSTWPIATSITNINTYNTFRDWFAHDSRTWNNDPNVIRDNISYQNYVHNNLNNSVQEYLKYGLNELLTNSVPNNMRLKTELSSFLTAIEQRRNDNEIVWGARINDAIQWNIWANDQMIKHRRRRILWIPFGRPDVSYMRFYNWASHEIKDQSVDISTNSRITDLNNPEPVKYDLKTNISGKNNINVTIDFPENDKRYRRKSITLKQWEVSTLARKILNCPDIPDFKVRAHIVYNMMVSMIQISKKKNFSLNYRVPGTALQREIIMNKENIFLIETNDTWGTRTENVLFDYDSFVTTNTFHGMWNSRSLQTAIDSLMDHFNFSMNQYHENYRNATRSRLLKTNVSANSFWTSPIKTVMNLRTVRQFDFTTNVGDVEISFEKNNITLKKWDIEISGKNLWKLLEYRKNKIRIFDGMEREIVWAFYEEMTKKLRENNKINRSNFWVRDPLTQNIYVLDEDGEFGVITPEDPGNILNGRNNRIIRKTELDDVDARGWRRMCTPEETKEIFMNPMIMWRMIKAMNRRM